MKSFFAMLKDSYREAVDGWIFPLMMILGLIVILLVGTISAEPLPHEKALPRMFGGQNIQIIHADRGQAKTIGNFPGLQTTLSKIVVSGDDTKKPWERPVEFEVEYGGIGMGIEMNDKKDPSGAKQVEGASMLSDGLTNAARYWASKPGEKLPKYTDQMGLEFVESQLRSCGFNVKSVTTVSGLPFMSSNKFRVKADGTSGRMNWTHTYTVFFFWHIGLNRGLGEAVNWIEDFLVTGFGAWILLLTGVIVTAAFIPNMMRKGAIDLLLTKPMSRPLILIYKYLGGMTFVALLTAFTISGVWLMIGIKLGIWATGILYCILGITFYFAVLYAMSTLIGVFSRNAIVCIVITIIFWFVIFLIGFLHNAFVTLNNMQISNPGRMQRQQGNVQKADNDEKAKTKEKEAEAIELDQFRIPEPLVTTFKVLNALTPRTKDLDYLTTQLIERDLLSESDRKQAGQKLLEFNWLEVLGTGSAWITALLGLAIFRFVTRSY